MGRRVRVDMWVRVCADLGVMIGPKGGGKRLGAEGAVIEHIHIKRAHTPASRKNKQGNNLDIA